MKAGLDVDRLSCTNSFSYIDCGDYGVSVAKNESQKEDGEGSNKSSCGKPVWKRICA